MAERGRRGGAVVDEDGEEVGDGTRRRGLSRLTFCDLPYDQVFLATMVKVGLVGAGRPGGGARQLGRGHGSTANDR